MNPNSIGPTCHWHQCFIIRCIFLKWKENLGKTETELGKSLFIFKVTPVSLLVTQLLSYFYTWTHLEKKAEEKTHSAATLSDPSVSNPLAAVFWDAEHCCVRLLHTRWHESDVYHNFLDNSFDGIHQGNHRSYAMMRWWSTRTFGWWRSNSFQYMPKHFLLCFHLLQQRNMGS